MCPDLTDFLLRMRYCANAIYLSCRAGKDRALCAAAYLVPSGREGNSGFTHDQFCVEQNGFGDGAWVADQVDQHVTGGVADLETGLADRCDGRCRHHGNVNVVKPNHRDILRYAISKLIFGSCTIQLFGTESPAFSMALTKPRRLSRA